MHQKASGDGCGRVSGSGAWRVVSVYADGDRVIESPRYRNRAHAEEALESVRRWRAIESGQDEVPRVEIEECEA